MRAQLSQLVVVHRGETTTHSMPDGEEEVFDFGCIFEHLLDFVDHFEFLSAYSFLSQKCGIEFAHGHAGDAELGLAGDEVSLVSRVVGQPL